MCWTIRRMCKPVVLGHIFRQRWQGSRRSTGRISARRLIERRRANAEATYRSGCSQRRLVVTIVLRRVQTGDTSQRKALSYYACFSTATGHLPLGPAIFQTDPSDATLQIRQSVADLGTPDLASVILLLSCLAKRSDFVDVVDVLVVEENGCLGPILGRSR